MNTPTDWTWYEEPPGLGWYAILECWEPEEGMFPGATLVQSLPLAGSHASGLVAHAGPFPTREAAEAWAQAHDPDGPAFAGTTTPGDPES